MKTLARATDTAHGDSVAQELDRLSHLQLPRLRAEWLERWGEEVAYRSRDQLFRAMAYRIQADAYGGLSGRLRRELSDLGARFAEDRGFSPGPSLSLKPGSTLAREWGGKRHEVFVVADGFVFNGRSCGSLSQVAFAITGTKWNGPVFFGVKARKSPALQGRAAQP